MKILVLAEHHNNELKKSTLNTITAGTKLSDTLDVFIGGANLQAILIILQKIQAVNLIHVIDNAEYEHQLAENMSQSIANIANNYDVIIAPHTTFGKNILPRVAALLDMPMLSDVTQIIDPQNYIRPIYAGNANAQMRLTADKKIFTVCPTVFDEVIVNETADATIQNIVDIINSKNSEFVSLSESDHSRTELASARVVVSGGRALKSKENFALIEQLADKLNAAVGASRAAVDAGFVPNDHQVGQTGKVVAPDLYIAIGISGAIQHVAGIKDAKVIVAINKDPDAPIFSIADYGIVGDLFELIPQMLEALP